ncbi:MAG: hypothetical protein HUU22_18840 [Phycisphaerae bacterium]|nr:hypothetical protein [Phycisphaerae bacterium]NUQ48075.1 hypothetical protein [Phycisphaerae bacterium]
MSKLRPEQRKYLLIGLVSAIGIYFVGNSIFFEPWMQVRRDIVSERERLDQLRKLQNTLDDRLDEWKRLTARTFARSEAQNRVDEVIKRLVADHQLVEPRVTTKLARGKMPRSKQMGFVECGVTAEASLDQLVRFLWDLYELPVLLKVTSLTVAPVETTGGGAVMKLDMKLASPVFPEERRGRDKYPPVRTIPREGWAGLTPLRRPAFPREEYDTVAMRNMFAAFEPPPKVRVVVHNDDPAPIDVRVESFWQGERTNAESGRVEPKQNWTSPWVVAGNRVELTATYDDGRTYKPAKPYEVRKRFVASEQTYNIRVPAYQRPPDDVELTIKNEDEAEVTVAIRMDIDGQMTDLAAVSVGARKQRKLEKRRTPKFEVTAHYAGGGSHGPTMFTPASTRPMLFVIPPKPIETVVADTPAVTTVAAPPADPNWWVSALWTFPGGQELIASHIQKKERKRIATNEALDGGEMIFVHSMGGIVKMPNGEYYLYPLGRKFTDRVLLEGAKSDADLPEAIRAWYARELGLVDKTAMKP